jgi:Protein of unknown function (DUF3800)
MSVADYQDPEYEYVAFIDESGDPGLSKVKPIDKNGSSEWLIVAAVVTSKGHEGEVDEWVRDIMSRIRHRQSKELHFSNLNPANKLMACERILTRPVRLFCIASNKKNMKGFSNPFANLRGLDSNWFYCWMTRLLIERVSHFISTLSNKRFRESRRIKLIFSTRGGLSYSQLKAYVELLRMQSRGNTLFSQAGNIYWETLHHRLLKIAPSEKLGGLQLADVCASAFFKACDVFDTGACDPSFAEALKPIVACTEYQGINDQEAYATYSGYGLKLLPSFGAAKLRADQKAIFDFYGYPRQWWDRSNLLRSLTGQPHGADRTIGRHGTMNTHGLGPASHAQPYFI